MVITDIWQHWSFWREKNFRICWWDPSESIMSIALDVGVSEFFISQEVQDLRYFSYKMRKNKKKDWAAKLLNIPKHPFQSKTF